MAKNEADQQPAFNFQIARTYLAAGDPVLARRTWQDVKDCIRGRYDQALREPILA